MSHFVLYVDASAPAGAAPDGQSWATAYPDLQAALDAANPAAGDDCEIRVADGTYKPTARTDAADPRSATFTLKNRVALYGGYAGHGADDPDARNVAAYATILSGDIGTVGDNEDNCVTVVTGSGTDATATIDSLTIRAGNAHRTGWAGSTGGGMFNQGGSPTIRNCTFTRNNAGAGGGMSNVLSSSPVLTNCVFIDNRSDGSGGGMFNYFSSPKLTDCAFIDNWSYSIDTITSTLALSSGSLSSDPRDSQGGGMFNYSSAPTLTHCSFISNDADHGGGMSNYESSAPALTNCTFTGNIGSISGGGMHNEYSSSPVLTNCAFSGNRAGEMLPDPGGAGGAMCNDSSSATLINCTLSGNWASSGGGIYDDNASSVPTTLTNCIVWGNVAPNGNQIGVAGSAPAITYSIVQGGYGGIGNMAVDPLFVRNPGLGIDYALGPDDYGDLRPRFHSPAVDAGNNGAVSSGAGFDLAGNPRFADITSIADAGAGTIPIIDLGAYEAVPRLEADAGGPYSMFDGDECVLWGHGQSDKVGALAYAWDFDADGLFDDATGETPAFSAVGVSGPLTRTIGLCITDSSGATITTSTTLTVTTPVAYVDDSATGAGNGRNWADAYTDLQAALAMTAPGQVIRVAQGTYTPTAGSDRTISFQLRSGATIEGGYAGFGAAAPDARDPAAHPSILSGDIGVIGSNADNSHHVVTGIGTDATAVFDGFTITAGKADALWNWAGAGMYNYRGSPIVRNCVFAGNSAREGGGMYNYFSSPTVTDCIFSGNQAYEGGGLCNEHHASPSLTNGTFTGNSAGYGGGVASDSSCTLINCAFIGNSASSNGGGMYNRSSPTLTNCTFNGNMAGSDGGGLFNYHASPTLTNCTFTGNSANQGGGIGGYSSCTLSNCAFIDNVAEQDGGGISSEIDYSPTLTACIFNGNVAGRYGGAMYIAHNARPILVNCAFAYNAAESGGGAMYSFSSPVLVNCTLTGNFARYGGGVYNVYYTRSIPSQPPPTFTNCILWGNSAYTGSQVYNASSAPTITYSVIQGGHTGTGNVNADPLFVRNPGPGPDGLRGTADDDYGDLRLQLTSPAIDAGRNSAVPSGITTDLAGNGRFTDIATVPNTGSSGSLIVDMGAYEAFVGVVVSGTAEADVFHLRSGGWGSKVMYLVNLGASGPSYTVDRGSLLILEGLSDEDSLIVSFHDGNPIAGATVRLEGGSVILDGLQEGSDVTVASAEVVVNGYAMSCAGVNGVWLDAAEGETVTLGVLQVAEEADVALTAGKGLTLLTSSLLMEAEGTLDLADGTLVVQAADEAGAEEALAFVRGRISAGRNAVPLWGGRGITSSVLRKGDDGLGGMLAAREGSTVIVRPVLGGDVDGNGRIDGDDYFALDAAFLAGQPQADLDYDGVVDGRDYFLADRAFLAQDAGVAGTFNGGMRIAANDPAPWWDRPAVDEKEDDLLASAVPLLGL